MSEVKRFDCTNGRAQHCYGCYQMTETAEGYYVSWDDFDAQRLRADTAEAELKELRVLSADQGLNLKRVKREFDSMKVRAEAAEQRAEAAEARVKTAEHDLEFFKAGRNEQFDRAEAAEQRIAELSELLHRSKVDAELWFSEFGEPSSGDYSAAFTEIDAALNPNPEAESHE